MKNKFIYLSILALGFASCDSDFKNEINGDTYHSGDADFSSYVAIGNSLTAGYMDGTVFRSGQKNSFPNILAGQFAVAGGGEFTQPSFEEDVNNLGGIAGLPGFGTRLIINASVGGPQNINGTSTVTLTPQAKAYHNMGVPGAKSYHVLVPGYGSAANLPNANPYFIRHATSASATVLGDAMTMNPTFFTNWIGANDVLTYATNGGANADGNTPAVDHNETGNTNPLTYGNNDITNSAVFAGIYNLIINGGTHPLLGQVTGLAQNGAKGVVATIPSVTAIPYFTTVPYNPLTPAALGGEANIATLNAQIYGPLAQVFTAYGEPNRVKLLSNTEANPILIIDVDAADRTAQITGALTPVLGAQMAAAFGQVYGKARQATASDLVVLPASSVIGKVNDAAPSPLINLNGVTFPMANKWVLTPTEQTKVASATTAYNNAIRSIADANGIAVADMNAIMNQLADFGKGLTTEDGQTYYANYFSTSKLHTTLFSLDGVHPNAKGYAIVANEIIKVINKHYKAHLPLVNASSYPGATILLSN